MGDVGSAVFTLAMACHLFADVVFDYRLDYTAFLAAMIAFWTFTYFCSTIGVIVHPSDFFMRAGMWCWISEKYMAERLWLHYVWILATEFGVVVIYALMFVVLWRRIRKFFYVSDDRQVRAESAARSVVVYPAVYVLCTLPAVIARLKVSWQVDNTVRRLILTTKQMMAGGKVGVKELTVVGVLMTSNGWLDCLVYALTRKSLIFGPAIQNDGVHGLETFTSWQQYPEVQEMDCWSPKTESNDGAIGKTPEMMQSSRSGDESTENLFQGKWHVENGRIVDTEAFPSKASFPMRSVRSDSDLRKSAGTRFPRRKDPCKKIADYEIQHKAQHEFAQAEPVADLGVIRRDANNILRTEQADTAIREQDVLEIEECPPSALHSQSPPEMKTVKFRSSSLDPKSPGRA